MATLETTTRRFIGLSTDQKPPYAQYDDGGLYVGTDTVPAGSSFFETDTWRIARYDGEQWSYPTEDAEITARLDALIGLMATQNELLEALADRL